MKELKFRQAIILPSTKKFEKWHFWGLTGDVFVGVDTGLCSPKVAVERSDQFIGIKDKSGKEIYGRDVVEFDNTEIGGQKYRGEIIFNTDATLGNLEWGMWTQKGYLRTDFLGKIEIIGNIHQNPELVEEL